MIAGNEIASYNSSLLSDRVAKEEGYLKRTTIYPGETISGYVNIEYKKARSITVVIDINGADYIFPWDIKK